MHIQRILSHLRRSLSRYQSNMLPVLSKRNRYGFTLIELILVIAVIAVLAGIVYGGMDVRNIFVRSHDTERRHNVKQLQNALYQHLIDEWALREEITETPKPICKLGITTELDPDCVSLDFLVPEYIACLPYDGAEEDIDRTGYDVKAVVGRPIVLSMHLGTVADETISCHSEPGAIFGNGAVEDGEQCDDGNRAALDGCDDNAAIESGFICEGGPSFCELSSGGTHASPAVVGVAKQGVNGFVGNLSRPSGIFVSGGYAYVANAYGTSLSVIDVTDKLMPGLESEVVDGVGGIDSLHYANDVFVSGDYIYVVSGFDGSNVSPYDNALTIFHVNHPAAPTLVSVTRDNEGLFTKLLGANSIFVQGDYAYITSVGEDALTIIDISNPAAPVWKSQITDGVGGFNDIDWPSSVYVSGDYAYVTSYDNALSIIDISNKENPVLAGLAKQGVNGAVSMMRTSDVEVSGNYAFVTAQDSKALSVFDITNKANPIQVGILTGQDLDGAYSVDISGDYAFVASVNADALSIVDISVKNSPVLITQIEDGDAGVEYLDGAGHVFVQGAYAYVLSRIDDSMSIFGVQ